MSQGEPVRVCIIPTGGTIASIYDSESQVYRPGMSVDTLLSYLPEGMGKIEVIKRELFQLDSANAQPHHWQEVASCIKAAYEEIPDLAGFVILHGTDTMVYTASAVSFMIQDFGKPIVFTGSQIPTSMPWSDGPRNLRDALRVAAWADLGETCIVFNGEIHRATRVKKLRDRDHDAFDSVDPIPLGMLARDIVLYEGKTKRHNLIPRFDTRLDDRVFLLKVFPGIPPSVISRIADMGYHGIVVEGYGSGNIPTQENALTGPIKQAISEGCSVLMSTQCAFGQADLSFYEVGKAALDVGALSAHDMTSEAAVVKLMWILGHTRDPDIVKEMILTNYVGEVTLSNGKTIRSKNPVTP
ncbi:MAG: asparaginase [Candidatus Thorarchaeota archaeon]|nr:asparaginase [Candidatus Thorarchaeota archaeon]